MKHFAIILLTFMVANISTAANGVLLSRDEAKLGPICKIPKAGQKLEIMDLAKVQYIVIEPSGLPYEFTPQMVQDFHVKFKNSCDVKFHYGIFPNNHSDRTDTLLAYNLRSTSYQGSFSSGNNNNLGIMVHVVSFAEARQTLTKVIKEIVESGQFTNLRGLKSGLQSGQNPQWDEEVKKLNETLKALF